MGRADGGPHPIPLAVRSTPHPGGIMRRFLVTWSLLLLTAGCHRYVPVRAGSVPAGTEVRVELSDGGAARMEGVLGRRTTEVAGELTEWSDRVVLTVPVAATAGLTDRALRRPVVLELDEVVGVDVRERDRLRTAVLIAGVVAAVGVAALAAFTGTFGGTSTGEDPPEQPEGSIIPLSINPLWRWIVPR